MHLDHNRIPIFLRHHGVEVASYKNDPCRGRLVHGVALWRFLQQRPDPYLHIEAHGQLTQSFDQVL